MNRRPHKVHLVSGLYDILTERHKPQNFNRSNVHIEDYILRQPEDINAKEMRVLIPAMFQKQLHPDKETTKTKVKGLWEPGNKPLDFPRDVDFKDPNNCKLVLKSHALQGPK